MELERLVGFRNRCPGRHGLPYPAPCIQVSETYIPDQSRGQLNTAAHRLCAQRTVCQVCVSGRTTPTGLKDDIPEVEVTWTDGGILPMKPEGWPAGRDIMIRWRLLSSTEQRTSSYAAATGVTRGCSQVAYQLSTERLSDATQQP